MTSRRPIRRTGKWAFQAWAQSASWTTDTSSSPIGRRLNAWRWPSACAGLADGQPGGGPIAAGQVGPDDRRLVRVDPRAEALVDQLEARLDAGPARGEARQDLADRLDRLEVGPDRQLDPGVAGAQALVVGRAGIVLAGGQGLVNQARPSPGRGSRSRS